MSTIHPYLHAIITAPVYWEGPPEPNDPAWQRAWEQASESGKENLAGTWLNHYCASCTSGTHEVPRLLRDALTTNTGDWLRQIQPYLHQPFWDSRPAGWPWLGLRALLVAPSQAAVTDTVDLNVQTLQQWHHLLFGDLAAQQRAMQHVLSREPDLFSGAAYTKDLYRIAQAHPKNMVTRYCLAQLAWLHGYLQNDPWETLPTELALWRHFGLLERGSAPATPDQDLPHLHQQVLQQDPVLVANLFLRNTTHDMEEEAGEYFLSTDSVFTRLLPESTPNTVTNVLRLWLPAFETTYALADATGSNPFELLAQTLDMTELQATQGLPLPLLVQE